MNRDQIEAHRTFIKEIREDTERHAMTISQLTKALEYEAGALVEKADMIAIDDGIKVANLEYDLEETIQDRNELIRDLIYYFEESIYDDAEPDENRKWIKRLSEYIKG